MKRPRLSEEERAAILRYLQESFILDRRRRRLYNKKYHKSLIYSATWVMRVLYIVAFFIAVIFHTKSGSVRDEIITKLEIENGRMMPERGVSKGTIVHFQTYSGKYASDVKEKTLPPLAVGDTIKIERNIFGKPIYFAKPEWGSKFSINIAAVFYGLVIFITFISLFFNDGLDPFTDRILWLAWSCDIIAIACYFFM